MSVKKEHMRTAIACALKGMRERSGGPFGAVVVKDGKIVGTGHNAVTTSRDPTAHAEIMAIREACLVLDSYQLMGCEIYTTCEPCPMCLGAVYWARLDRLFYACSKEDAANAGFDDAFIYQEIELDPEKRKIPFESVPMPGALSLFKEWLEDPDKHEY